MPEEYEEVLIGTHRQKPEVQEAHAQTSQWKTYGGQNMKARSNDRIDWDNKIQTDEDQGLLNEKIEKEKQRTLSGWLGFHKKRKKQASAFSDYTRDRFYKPLNTGLRDQEAPRVDTLADSDKEKHGPAFYKAIKNRWKRHQIKSRVKEMDPLMEAGLNTGEHNRVEQETVVYRGINSAEFRNNLFKKVGLDENASAEQLTAALKGQNLEFSDRAYMSTSLKRSTAKNFALGLSKDFQEHPETGVLIEGVMPKGMRGLYISPLIEKKKGEQLYTEYEMLLSKNSRFRVYEARMDDKGKLLILRGQYMMAKMGGHRLQE